jgi:hypothetical protein
MMADFLHDVSNRGGFFIAQRIEERLHGTNTIYGAIVTPPITPGTGHAQL